MLPYKGREKTPPVYTGINCMIKKEARDYPAESSCSLKKNYLHDNDIHCVQVSDVLRGVNIRLPFKIGF